MGLQPGLVASHIYTNNHSQLWVSNEPVMHVLEMLVDYEAVMLTTPAPSHPSSNCFINFKNLQFSAHYSCWHSAMSWPALLPQKATASQGTFLQLHQNSRLLQPSMPTVAGLHFRPLKPSSKLSIEWVVVWPQCSGACRIIPLRFLLCSCGWHLYGLANPLMGPFWILVPVVGISMVLANPLMGCLWIFSPLPQYHTPNT